MEKQNSKKKTFILPFVYIVKMDNYSIHSMAEDGTSIDRQGEDVPVTKQNIYVYK